MIATSLIKKAFSLSSACFSIEFTSIPTYKEKLGTESKDNQQYLIDLSM